MLSVETTPPVEEHHGERDPKWCAWVKAPGMYCSNPAMATVENTRSCGKHIVKFIELLAPAVLEEHRSIYVQVKPDSIANTPEGRRIAEEDGDLLGAVESIQ